MDVLSGTLTPKFDPSQVRSEATVSDKYVEIIPTDPQYLPDAEVIEATRRVLAELTPNATAVTAEVWGRVEFVHGFSNFSGADCAVCDADLDEWLYKQLDLAFIDGERGFGSLDVVTPCCKTATTLNDLAYRWTSGFSRFSLRSERYDRSHDFYDHERALLASALGCEVRAVFVHI
jgi:hypothetical protein